MKKRAFTLVEMLAVIAIIGILAALIMPAIQKAKSTAYGSTCLNNYKQIANALDVYKAQYKGYLPRNETAQSYPRDPRRPNGSLNVVDHIHGILDYKYLHSFTLLERRGNSFRVDPNSGGEVWSCPVIYPLTATRPITGTRPLGMHWNGPGGFRGGITGRRYDHDFFGGNSRRNQRLENGRDIRMSAPLSNIPLCFEICDGARTRDEDHIGGYTTEEGVPCPHNGGMTVIWADSHVAIEQIPPGQRLNPVPEGENNKFVSKDKGNMQ